MDVKEAASPIKVVYNGGIEIGYFTVMMVAHIEGDNVRIVAAGLEDIVIPSGKSFAFRQAITSPDMDYTLTFDEGK